MWRTKKWRYKDTESWERARNAMTTWIEANQHRYQIALIFVNNAMAVEYRPLRVIG